MYECLDADIEFSMARWTTSSPSLYFQANDYDSGIVVNEQGTFFVYSQVCALYRSSFLTIRHGQDTSTAHDGAKLISDCAMKNIACDSVRGVFTDVNIVHSVRSVCYGKGGINVKVRFSKMSIQTAVIDQ